MLSRPTGLAGICKAMGGRESMPPNSHPSISECPRQELNLVYDLRTVACRHHTPRTGPGVRDQESGVKTDAFLLTPESCLLIPGKEPTTGFAPAWSALRVRRLSVSSHVGGSAGAQGFEPCAATLEIACSPRSTLLTIKGRWRESNPHRLVHGQPCRFRYTTATISRFQISDFRFQICSDGYPP